MAAILPAIGRHGEHLVSQSPILLNPTPPSKSAHGSANVYVHTGKRYPSKKEREKEQRKVRLRAQQSELSKNQTSYYRNSYKHNMCLDMLCEGFHKSFSELFALIKMQNEEREKAGPESVLWNQELLENECDKLDMLREQLCLVENAMRQGNYAEVYTCRFKLARYFQSTNDKWLSDHFFESCLATATGIKTDEGKMAAEGHCNVGLALEESGDLHDAAKNFENFFALTEGHEDWIFDNDKLMHCEACIHLTRIYTAISDVCKESDLSLSIEFLTKATEMSLKSGDKQLHGEACFRLGSAYEKNGDPETALTYLNKYLEICRSLRDNAEIGKACEAIAKAFEKKGKIEESIRYLEMFVEVAEQSQDEKSISRACSDLGTMFNSLGRYDQAVDYFNRSYNISRSLNDVEAISSSRVLFGVAAAHKMVQNFSQHVELGGRICMERLLEWKDNRGDEFDKELPKSERILNL
ncbi:hypothetical protein CAPTEDRAFT_228860 [Capitella teleta]|uniref:Tetratricopeptide repeat protein 29 n=1 Tax=Capitella teleta TaxID=283909 RepID=R7T566_CAPTE|nr:hypothetical protein CAPTEDRAFT_228860 [Capitella teleta]|eukprot:ELT88178.1 hypothetical protein CAPTEDRAFT_228860 [Capitella teleta]